MSEHVGVKPIIDGRGFAHACLSDMQSPCVLVPLQCRQSYDERASDRVHRADGEQGHVGDIDGGISSS